MTENSLNCLTDRHLLLFGTIIHWFARYELLMQAVIANVAGSDLAAVMLVTRDLDFSKKHSVVLDLLRHRAIPIDQLDRVGHYLTIPRTRARLRNDIAHSTWILSESPHLIQPEWIFKLPPRIKPVRDDSDVPGEHYIERNEDQLAYSLDDLEEIVAALAENHRRFSEYLLEVGLIHRSGL
jgi:hypothetical protein